MRGGKNSLKKAGIYGAWSNGMMCKTISCNVLQGAGSSPVTPPELRSSHSGGTVRYQTARVGLVIKNEVVNMAARLTDKQKKKIVADYLETESYNATAKKNGVCGQTVRRVVEESQEFSENLKQKKDQNTADILAYMESKRQEVCGIIDIGLAVLPDKIRDARTASEVTTALGTLIDKFTANGRGIGDTREKDPLSKSLEEMAKGLESDG